MASTNAMLLSLVLVFVFIGSSLARPYYHGYRTVELRTICDGTINPQYCWDNLSPGYGTGTAEDCYRVADGSIDVACNSAREIHDLLGNMVESTNDPQLRTLYRSCAARYNTAIRDLEHAKKYLLSGDYQRVAYEATHALQDVSECKERFPGYSYGGRFPGYPFDGGFPGYLLDSSRLTERMQDFEVRCSILSNVANYFPTNY